MAFSLDAQHLLSVSRDRRWSLFTKQIDADTFELSATVDKKTSIHTRIIWCCNWTHDSKYFATGSRDGLLVIWKKTDEAASESLVDRYRAASQPLNLKGESVTAVAFAPDVVVDTYLVAVGLDTGVVILYTWDCANFKQLLLLDIRCV